MCFSQGKAFVYEPEDDPGTIVTEWPNGVIDRHHLETKTRVRHWPDGTAESRHEDETVQYPMWPRPRHWQEAARTTVFAARLRADDSGLPDTHSRR